MNVISAFTSPWLTYAGALDLTAAGLFLRGQASWLCQALGRVDDTTAVGIVLGAHDASHESWLALISAVQSTCGDAAAAEVAQLYGFHGRVVGSLERGLDRRLGAEVAQQVRTVLQEHLADLTEGAISRLHGSQLGHGVEAFSG